MATPRTSSPADYREETAKEIYDSHVGFGISVQIERTINDLISAGIATSETGSVPMDTVNFIENYTGSERVLGVSTVGIGTTIARMYPNATHLVGILSTL